MPLVYHYRASGAPVVKGGLAVISQQELNEILKNHPDLQMGSKKLQRGALSVDVYQRDVSTPSQIARSESYPNSEQNVAGVRLPLKVWLGSALAGRYSELVILSRKQ